MFPTDSILLYLVFASTLQVNLMPNPGTIFLVWEQICGHQDLYKVHLTKQDTVKATGRTTDSISDGQSLRALQGIILLYITGFVILNVKCHELPFLSMTSLRNRV